MKNAHKEELEKTHRSQLTGLNSDIDELRLQHEYVYENIPLIKSDERSRSNTCAAGGKTPLLHLVLPPFGLENAIVFVKIPDFAFVTLQGGAAVHPEGTGGAVRAVLSEMPGERSPGPGPGG